MTFFYILAITAAIISSIAGWFSITGLALIFPAAARSVMIMGGALELGKLVSASWLYRFWGVAPRLIRAYFLAAILILSSITSLGIFGVLSRAHLDGAAERNTVNASIEVLDGRINDQVVALNAANAQIAQMDKAINTLSGSTRTAVRSMNLRTAQQTERKVLGERISATTKTIDSLRVERSSLVSRQQNVATELGPLMYVADMMYGKDDPDRADKAVRLLTFSIMLVFDPLAILLVVAANMQLASLRKKPEAATADTSWDPNSWFEIVDAPLDKPV